MERFTKAEFIRNYSKQEQLLVDLKDERDSLYKQIQSIEDKINNQRINPRDPSTLDYRNLHSVIVLNEEYLAKVHASIYSDTHIEPFVSTSLHKLNEHGRSTEHLNAWDVALSFPYELSFKVRGIQQLLDAWMNNEIAWPWPVLSERDFHGYWEE